MTTERLVTEYTADTRNFRRGAQVYDQTLARQQRLTNDRLSRIDQRWERSTRNILSTRTALAGLTTFVGGAALNQLRSYAEQWRDVERRLQSIGVTSTDAQRDLIDLAIRTRSSVGGTAAAVQRMAKSTGDGIEVTTRRVETLQKLLAAGGAGGSERASVSLQLGQALQSGVLSGDEFRSIRENAPVEFLDALAKAAGITRKELKGFAEEQKLTSDIVLRALDDLASTADEKFGALAISGEEAFSVLTTGLVAYVGNVDKSLGATASLNSAMAFLGEYMAGAGEGAQTMAQSIKIVGAVALATAGGRGLGAMNKALRDSAEARRLNVSAAQSESRASRQAVIDARAELAAKRSVRRERELDHQRQVFNDRGTVQSAQRRRAAIIAEEQALSRLKAAQMRATASTAALTAAQRQLSVATRLTTGAVRAFNGVMAFFGGPIGLGLTLAATTLSVMATRTSEVDRLTQGVTDRVGELQQAYASAGDSVDELRKKMATTSLAQAITDAKDLERELESVREVSLQLLERVDKQSHLRKNDEFSALVYDLVEGRVRASEFRLELNRIVASSGDASAGLVQIFDPILKPLLEVTESSEKAADILLVLRGNGDEAAGALKRLGLAASDAETQVDDLGVSANAAAAGIAGLIAQIPALQKAAQVQDKLATAVKNRDAALKGLNGQGLSGTERLQEEKRILGLYQQAVSEIDGTAQATRDADKALNDYLDQSKITALDARGQALERENQRYQQVVASLEAAKAGEAALTAAAEAHARNRASIEERFASKGGSGGGVSKATKADLRNLGELREALIESGQRELYVESALNAERKRLADLMPTMIALGLSRADAQEVVNAELERTEERLKRVKSASEEAAEAFAQGVLSDIRHADNLGDAIGRIADRLMDLALDPVFDFLADQFASLGRGGGGGVLGQIAGFIFPGLANANGNAFNGSGVVPFARGGVVDRPTFFNFAGNRKGVMGEAGPEAILPLSRGKNGKLGVVAELPTTPTLPTGSLQTNSAFSWTGDMVIQSQSDQPQEVGREVMEQMYAMFNQMFSKQLGDAMRINGVLDQKYQKKAGF
ncbi:tape measure protein [Rhodobacteraceae bacterium G21628-S1]|nr:tape measure protein [Rhodobacteraceae bacterium G21628-S1]